MLPVCRFDGAMLMQSVAKVINRGEVSPARRDPAAIVISETIIHAGSDCVDRIFETGYGHGCVGAGQRKSLAAEVMIIVLECRRPAWRECPLCARPSRPPGPGTGRAGVNSDPPTVVKASSTFSFVQAAPPLT